MLTNEDIVNIVQSVVKAEKELFYTKPELDEKFQKMQDSFSTLQTSVDAMTKLFKQYVEEQKIYVHRLNRLEDWVKQAATKLGLEYKV